MKTKTKTKLLSYLIPLCLPIILFLIFTIGTRGFGVNSIPIIISQSLIPFILSFSIVIIISTGLFDLSIGTQMIVIGILVVWLSEFMGAPGLLIGSIGGSVMCAALKGGIYRLLRIPSIILSIGLVMILEYFGIEAMRRTTTMVLFVKPEVSFIGAPPYNYIFTVVAAALFYLIYNYTVFGIHIKLVGDNELTAFQVGIKVNKIKYLAFVISGVFVGFATILYTCYSGSIGFGGVGMSTIALVFRPLIAVMIGISLNRFCNNLLLNLFIAVISLNIIFNGLIAFGLPASTQDITLGVFLLIVMSVTENTNRLREWRRRRTVRKEKQKIIA